MSVFIVFPPVTSNGLVPSFSFWVFYSSVTLIGVPAGLAPTVPFAKIFYPLDFATIFTAPNIFVGIEVK
jgi:hypothetical protein